MDGYFKTGIAMLDDHMGGFLRGKPYLVFGEAGTGKSLLGMQYLLQGTMQGEAGVYLSMERPADLISLGQSLGLDPAPAVDRGDLIFLEYDRDVTGRILRFGWKPFLEQLHSLGGERDVRRIVFDPILPLFAGTAEEGRLRYDLRYLVESMEEWGWTPLLLNDRGSTQGHPSLYRVFSEICSGVFELQDEVENLESCKYVFIHKLRQSSDRMRKIPFQVVQGKGLVESDHRSDHESGATTVARAAKRARPRILLADDDPFVRSLLKKSLRDEFDLTLASDGVEALTLTLRERPDVLVLDVVLPQLGGFEVCRALRASGIGVPILMVSGLTDPDERVRGLVLGANDFITKPFDLRELVEKIRVASRYRVVDSRTPAGPVDIETLLNAARSRVLPAEQFKKEFSRVCEDVLRYGSSLGIARMNWDGASGNGHAARLIDELERNTRSEDLLAVPDGREAVIVLNTESIDGTVAYLRKLRRIWAAGGPSELPGAVRNAIRVSYWAFTAHDGRLPLPEAMLDEVGEPRLVLFEEPKFAPGTAIPSSGGSKATGTAG